jgi:Flp pilus assembly protein TadD
MLLAQMLMENGKTGRALTEFELAAQYGSDRALPHYNYGLALYESGMKEDALKQWTIAYNLANDNPMYVAAMGMAYTGEDDRKALAFYEKAESLGAGGHKFNHNYGLLLERLGQFKRAEERFQVALQESPDNPSYELSLAALFMKTKAYSMAVPLWKRLLQAKPGELSYHIYLARAYLELEEYDEAKATLTQVSDKWERAEGHSQALDSSPSSPGIDQAFEIFAMACRGKGDLKEALVYIRKALEIAPQNPVHLNNYGVILAENGMIDEARAQWEKALSLDPGNEAASKNLLIYKK